MGGQCSLRVGGAGDGLLRAGKRGEERVALGVDLVTMPPLEQRSQQVPLILEDLGVLAAQSIQEARRPLDVGEQERDRAGRYRDRDLLRHAGLGHRTGALGHVRSPVVALAVSGRTRART